MSDGSLHSRLLEETEALRAETKQLRRRIRLARSYVRSLHTGDVTNAALALAASKTLDLRKPLKGRR